MKNLDILIEKLKQNLDTNTNVLTVKYLLQSYDNKDWKKYIKVDDNEFNKIILYQNDVFELILICWGKGAETPIHYHPKNGCLLKVLEGELTETIYLEGNSRVNILTPSDIGYMHDDIGQHKITVSNDSFSLHLYSPPEFY